MFRQSVQVDGEQVPRFALISVEAAPLGLDATPQP
jgi:hypothetical protein